MGFLAGEATQSELQGEYTDTRLRCIALLYFAIRLESRKSVNKRIYLSIYLSSSCMNSGVARNFRQGVHQSAAFLSVYSRLAALPSRPYNQKTS